MLWSFEPKSLNRQIRATTDLYSRRDTSTFMLRFFILIRNYTTASTRSQLSFLDDTADKSLYAKIKLLKQNVIKFSLNVRMLELMPNQKKEILFAVRNLLEEYTYFNLRVGEIISESGKYSLDELSKTLKITYAIEPMMLKPNEVGIQSILFDAGKSP